MHSDSETTGLEQPVVQDGVPFVDLETGLTCVVLYCRDHWNGYVQIPPGHIFYQKGYYTCVKPGCQDRDTTEYKLTNTTLVMDHCQHTAEHMLEIHGGITFAGYLQDGQHINLGDAWWLGFDTAHAWDTPGYGTYKDMDYVLQETLKLAKQLV